MMVAAEWSWGIKARVLRFVGDGTSETDHMTFLADGRFYEETVDALLEAIARFKWDVVHFTQVPSTSPSAIQIAAFAGKHGWMVAEERVACPISVLPPSYESLLAGMAPRFRTMLRSTRRKLSESHLLEFGEVTDMCDVAPALEFALCQPCEPLERQRK